MLNDACLTNTDKDRDTADNMVDSMVDNTADMVSKKAEKTTRKGMGTLVYDKVSFLVQIEQQHQVAVLDCYFP